MSEYTLVNKSFDAYMAVHDSEGDRQRTYDEALITAQLIGTITDKVPTRFLMPGADTVKVAHQPEQLDADWPTALYRVAVPVGATLLNRGNGLLSTSAIVIRSRENPYLVLGPQRDDIVAMADRAKRITRDEQQAMTELTADMAGCAAARARIKDLEKARGRHNTSPCLRLMWYTNGRLTARHPIGNAITAVAQRDLLRKGVNNPDYQLLMAPWQTVIGQVGRT